jgi:DNA primase
MTNADHTSAARNTPIEQVINQRGIKLRGKVERTGPCPLCGGNDRFSINTKKNVFNCRGCDVGGSVIDLVMHLDHVDFATAVTSLAGPISKANGKDTSSQKKVVVASYEYHDANGALVLVKDRVQYQNSDGTFILKDGKPDKSFRQRRPDPDHAGNWIFNASGVPIVPYRLPQLVEAIAADHPVLIVEGEGKADLLWSWNIAATCNPDGAKKWKSEHSEFLRGADVVLVPDNDDPGWKHVHEVGASLVGVAKRIRVLRLPNLRDKGDVIDWAAAGGTREQLDALLNDAPAWIPPTIGKTGEQTTVEKAKAKAREDELLDALAKAEGLEYVRQRNAARQVARLRRSTVTGLSSRGLNQSMVIHCCAISSIAIVVILSVRTKRR